MLNATNIGKLIRNKLDEYKEEADYAIINKIRFQYLQLGS